MKRSYKILIIFAFLMIFVWASLTRGRSKPVYISQNSEPPISADINQGTISKNKLATQDNFQPPLDRDKERVTKKPFGIFITPQNSPVKPERFFGYHTGADLEIFPDELNKDVPVKAVCDGKVLVKKWASGYGGVMVESCVLNNQPVTVIYGHLNVNSIPKKVGDTLMSGEQIGILGRDKSQETDGERKHLHLGIHKGVTINIRGYVNNKNQLGDWIDPVSIL